MSDAPISELFDQLAEEYDTLRVEVGWKPWAHIFEALGERDVWGMNVLDIGCASGEVAEGLMDRGAQVVGLDVSAEMGKIAQERVPGLIFIEHDLADPIPFPDDTFDFTLALGCVEFVEDIEAACREMVRVTKPGGVLLYVIELCGPGYALGEARSIVLYEVWSRHRRTREEIQTTAREILVDPRFDEVPAYFEEDTEAQIMYLRVIGTAPGA